MRKVWAIVRLTLAESLRKRVAIAFVLLLVGMLVLIVSTAKGDGTLIGKVQMFISYSVGVIYFLLALLVILLSCRTIDEDIKTMRIDSLVSKPIARWQLLLGRWLGIVILSFGLLVISLSAVYVITQIYVRSAPAKSPERFKVENYVLVARKSFVPPPIPDIDKKVEQIYQQLKKEGRLPPPTQIAPSKVRQMIKDGLLRQPRTVGPRHMRTWKVSGLKPVKDSKGRVLVTLRFKYEPSKTTSPDPKHNLHSNTIFGYWIIGKRTSKNSFYWPANGPAERPYRTVQQIDVPVNVIEPDGTLTFSFVNIDPRNVAVHFPLKDGLEVLARVGDFTPNFIRLGLIAFAGIVFLATLGIACGTFLSFPIASLVSFSVFFIGIASNFLSEAIDMIGSEKGVLERVERIVTYVAIKLVPELDLSRYTSLVIDGRLIDWRTTLTHIGWLIGVNSLLLAIFAVIVFERRELGKVTV